MFILYWFMLFFFFFVRIGAINRCKSLLYVCRLQHGQSETRSNTSCLGCFAFLALSYQCRTKKTAKLCMLC